MKQFKDIDAKWRDHLMTAAAFRYSLGRQTYIVTECVQWLTEFWEDVPVCTQDLILKETQEAIDNGLAGDKDDSDLWQYLLDQVNKKAAPEEAALST